MPRLDRGEVGEGFQCGGRHSLAEKLVVTGPASQDGAQILALDLQRLRTLRRGPLSKERADLLLYELDGMHDVELKTICPNQQMASGNKTIHLVPGAIILMRLLGTWILEVAERAKQSAMVGASGGFVRMRGDIRIPFTVARVD